MKVYIGRFEKEEKFNLKVDRDITRLNIAIHPVISVEETELNVYPFGSESTIAFQGRVVEHTKIVKAFRDIADMIEKKFGNKTVQEFIDKTEQEFTDSIKD